MDVRGKFNSYAILLNCELGQCLATTSSAVAKASESLHLTLGQK